MPLLSLESVLANDLAKDQSERCFFLYSIWMKPVFAVNRAVRFSSVFSCLQTQSALILFSLFHFLSSIFCSIQRDLTLSTLSFLFILFFVSGVFFNVVFYVSVYLIYLYKVWICSKHYVQSYNTNSKIHAFRERLLFSGDKLWTHFSINEGSSFQVYQSFTDVIFLQIKVFYR